MSGGWTQRKCSYYVLVVAFYTYILASQRNGTLYVGSTDSLTKRVWEHKAAIRAGFTAKYGVKLLVWYEVHDTRGGAFTRERQIKEWKRAWKLGLIEKRNPDWQDLYEDFLHGSAVHASLLFPPLVPAEAGTQYRLEPMAGGDSQSQPSSASPS